MFVQLCTSHDHYVTCTVTSPFLPIYMYVCWVTFNLTIAWQIYGGQCMYIIMISNYSVIGKGYPI